MEIPRAIAPALAHYPFVAQTVQFVHSLNSAGGFSGAALWQVQAADETFCLRRWPDGTSDKRLEFIHAALRLAASRGLSYLPVPITASTGGSFVELAGMLWELTVWLPGEANFHRHAAPEKLSAAMIALTKLHRVWSEWPPAGAPFADGPFAPSPGIVSRLEQLRELEAGKAGRMAAAVSPGDWPELAARARPVLERFFHHAPAVRWQLETAAKFGVPLQPVIRDVWHDHVLYMGNEVTGIVDFGAMRVDSVACDLARLLGSFVRDDQSAWASALATYETIRPLSPNERRLIDVFDRSASLLAGMNWLDWIYLQQRHFPNRAGVIARLDEILTRTMQHID